VRLLRFMPIVAVPVLVATGIAVAAGEGSGPTTTQVAASFSATAQHVYTKTCTGSEGAYTLTDAAYSGTVSGSLTGGAGDTLVIRARSLINQTTGDGTTVGRFRITSGTLPVAQGWLDAVASGSGTLSGLLVGHRDTTPAGAPRQQLIANFTGTLSANGIGGQIGGNGTTTNSAVAQHPAPCRAIPPHPPHWHPHHHPLYFAHRR
jgi:hypothetical protein